MLTNYGSVSRPILQDRAHKTAKFWSQDQDRGLEDYISGYVPATALHS